MAKKLGSSASALAKPDSAAHLLAVEFQKWILLGDPAVLYTVMGTVAANMVKGVPVWLLLVGPQGCGKNLMVDSLAGIPKVRPMSDLTGTAALLSGVKEAERKKGASGGLLNEIGLRGLITISEFGCILSMPRDVRDQMLNAFRRIHDGHYDRDVGTDGGRKLIWPAPGQTGSIGFIGGCVPEVDKYHGVINKLGNRWLYFRYTKSDFYEECKAALQDTDRTKTKKELADAVKYFSELLLDLEGNHLAHWGRNDKNQEVLMWDRERRSLTQLEETRITAMATLMGNVRTECERDYRGNIRFIPAPEAPQRLAQSLGQLYIGLELIGLKTEARWDILERVAFDSAPEMKTIIIKRLRQGPVEVDELMALTNCSRGIVVWAVNDLEIFKVAAVDQTTVRLTDKAQQWLSGGWKDLP